MKLTKLVASALLASTVAAPSFAADLPSRQPPAVYVAPAPILTWSGFYAGLNAGYGWMQDNAMNTLAAPGVCDPLFPGCAAAPNYSVTSALGSSFSLNGGSQGGFIGGGQIGYNAQFGSFVAGVETDIQGIALGGNNGAASTASVLENPNFIGFPIVTTATSQRKIDWLGTARGRLGFTITPSFLVYATGGLAYGGVKARTTIVQSVPASVGLPNGASIGAFSDTRIGYTIGGGLEWMFAPNWSLKGEYLYYDLGRVSYTQGTNLICVTPACAVPGGLFASSLATTTTRFNGHIARAGINYHFNWGAPAAVVAKY